MPPLTGLPGAGNDTRGTARTARGSTRAHGTAPHTCRSRSAGWSHDCTRKRRRPPTQGRRRRSRRPAGRHDGSPAGHGRRPGRPLGVGEMVEQPAKVMRIGTMIKQLLEEVRAAPLDEASRNRLRDIHAASIRELEEGLAPELREELERITLPFTEGETPSRRRAAHRAGPAGRLAGGRLPRHPDGAVRAADGRPRPAGGDPAPALPSGQARPAARLPPRWGPVPLTTVA